MISLIVAYSKNKVIGNKGCIPWKIKGEQKRFKELTIGNIVIMGRKTFEEIGKPLSNRTTIVISSTQTFVSDNLYTAKSLSKVIKLAKTKDKNKNIFIVGGAKLYEEALSLVEKMYITEIDKIIDGDTFFPIFSSNDFDKEINKTFKGEIPYTYITYTRK